MGKIWQKRLGQPGFTLVELLVVIVVISGLAGGIVALINPVSQIQKAHDAARKNDLHLIQQALEQYYQSNGSSYPKSSSDFKIVFNGASVDWGSAGFAPYLQPVPKDPGDRKYVYYSQSGQSYILYASLERGANDAATCMDASGHPGASCPNVPSGADCGGVCNYGVSSGNTSP